MVQGEVLEKIDDPELRVYAVWEPILARDSEATARRAAGLLPDRRASHFWIADRSLGAAFQRPLGLATEPAWDVYLVFAPGRRWETSAPGPDFFMHRLRGRLPDDRLLDGPALLARLRALSPAPATP